MKNFLQFLFSRKDLNVHEKDISFFVEKCGQQNIRFENLSPRCAGISFPDECILSKKLMEFPKEVLLYVLFHEIAHQYQYQKWGKNLMYEVYVNLPIDEAVSKLLEIESIADRLAMLKLRSVIGTNHLPPYRYYGCQNIQFFKDYLVDLRSKIKGMETIEEINLVIKSDYL